MSVTQKLVTSVCVHRGGKCGVYICDCSGGRKEQVMFWCKLYNQRCGRRRAHKVRSCKECRLLGEGYVDNPSLS